MFAILTLLVAMFSIQSGASLAKQLFPILGVQGTTTMRIGFAAILLCLVWRPWRKKLKPQELKNVLFYGTALGLMNLLFYLSLERIPLGIAVALEFTGPLALTLWSSRKKFDFLWAVLAIIGIIFVLPLGETSAAVDLLGAFYALLAGACWAFYIIFGQRISAALHGGIGAAYGMAVAALVVLPFGVISTGSGLLQISILPLAFAVAVLSSAVPYSLEMIALKALPTKTFGILMSMEPAVAALSGFVFLAERLELIQWMAILCVIVASVGSTVTAGKRKLSQIEKSPPPLL